ncbi:MAG: Ditrans,polycis-undecaprenyl-diphosphate synthase ((2E,6E)-farnesyl-diphosphate specific) [Pseudomonadales bacterium]|nr:Ditrans,polycis-undecaprenyl-diphosphate synthase ((2E,6E)-farnesyl-diphosphate specific) [Pseudomonadales bacterium]
MQSPTKSEGEVPPRVPQHVAVIMDGNGRWARARGLPAVAGHRAGVEVIRKLLGACREHGVAVLTLFAFSSENWQRPREEVRGLMALFARYLRREVRELHASGVRLRVIGDRVRFGPRIVRLMDEAERQTAANTTSTLVIAADYGGQWDIVQGARALAHDVAAGRLDPERIDSAALQQRLCLGDLPQPDLLIRTGGDHRISNFLLWQIAYTELYFTECYWPDFDTGEFAAALRDYAARERRFGARPAAPGQMATGQVTAC